MVSGGRIVRMGSGRPAVLGAVFVALALTGACSDPVDVASAGDPPTRATPAVDAGPPVSVELGSEMPLRLPRTRSSLTVDGSHLAGIAPGSGVSDEIVVVDLASEQLDAAAIPLPEELLATAAWAAGGEVYALAQRCLEYVPPIDGSAELSSLERECLRAEQQVLSVANPLVAGEADQVQWRIDHVGEQADPGQLPVFEFANDSAAYLAGSGGIVRFDHATATVSTTEMPPRTWPVGVCGTVTGENGVVVVLGVGDGGGAEPDRNQVFGDFAHGRLLPDGKWRDIAPSDEWDLDATALGGRCVGGRPSLLDRTTAEAWVLGADDEWESWGELAIDGSTSNGIGVGGDHWVVRAEDWLTSASSSGIALLGDHSTASIEPERDPADDDGAEWGVVLADGSFVGQFSGPDGARRYELIRGEVR